MANSEGAIAAGSAAEAQLHKVINTALERIGARKLDEPTIEEQLDTWFETKKGATSDATLVAYQQARDLLLAFLSPRARLSIRMVRTSDAVAFRDQLLIISPFESARKKGLIDFNPFIAAGAYVLRFLRKKTRIVSI